jgi:hypothetical protein
MSDKSKEQCQRLNDIISVQDNPPELVHRLESLTPRELNELIPSLSSTGSAGEALHALRDTVQAVLYRKLADSSIAAISDLNTATSRLTKVGWVLSIMLGILGILATILFTFWD